MTVVTYITRVSFLIIFRKIVLPNFVVRSFKYIPIGIFSALIISGIFVKDGGLNLSLNNPYWIAAIASSLMSYWLKNVFVSMLTGILTVIILS